MRGPTAKWQKPLAYQIAAYEEQRMERAERERLFYVAVTRARDYLILSGPVAKKSKEDWMSMLLNALGYPWEDDGPPEGDVDDMRVWWHEG